MRKQTLYSGFAQAFAKIGKKVEFGKFFRKKLSFVAVVAVLQLKISLFLPPKSIQLSVLRNIESWIERTLTAVIDFFYPPFRKVMSLELFRYGACGGLNLALEWVLYYVFYHFVFHEQVFDLGFIAFTPHIAAFVFKFPITFLTGFWMARHISFSGSTLRGRTQIIRYFLVTIGNILLNYFGLKLFVEILQIWPTVSYIIISVICVTFSYLTNKFYSFRKAKKTEDKLES